MAAPCRRQGRLPGQALSEAGKACRSWSDYRGQWATFATLDDLERQCVTVATGHTFGGL